MPRQDRVPEARGEPLDLCLDLAGHFDLRGVRDMTIGPCCVSTRGCPRWIKKAGLRQKDERPLRMFSSADRGFRRRDFFQSSSEVNGPRPTTRLRGPGNWVAQCPVELERPRSV